MNFYDNFTLAQIFNEIFKAIFSETFLTYIKFYKDLF